MINEEIPQPQHPSVCPQCAAATDPNTPFCGRCKQDLRYGSRNRTRVGNCIYCEATCKFSEEHVFPRWLRNHFPRRYKKTAHCLTRPERHVFWKEVPVHSQEYQRTGDPYETVVLNVCESCNNGWMSKLQDETKPLITILAGGCWPALTEADQLLLAKWCAMVSINLECHARMLATTQRQRTALMQGTMPPGWRVSIGLMKDESCAGDSFHRAVQVPIGVGSDGFLRIQSTYFCIERVAFHTVSSLGDQILSLGLLGAGLSDMKLPTSPIWPNVRNFDKSVGTGLVMDDLLSIQRNFSC